MQFEADKQARIRFVRLGCFGFLRLMGLEELLAGLNYQAMSITFEAVRKEFKTFIKSQTVRRIAQLCKKTITKFGTLHCQFRGEMEGAVKNTHSSKR